MLNLKQNIITLPYAKSARLIFEAVANKSTSSSTQYRTISSVNLTIANGNVECPNDLIDTIINTALNSANLTLYDTSGNVSVFLYSCDLLIEFDFPASFDSNWNWQP